MKPSPHKASSLNKAIFEIRKAEAPSLYAVFTLPEKKLHLSKKPCQYDGEERPECANLCSQLGWWVLWGTGGITTNFDHIVHVNSPTHNNGFSSIYFSALWRMFNLYRLREDLSQSTAVSQSVSNAWWAQKAVHSHLHFVLVHGQTITVKMNGFFIAEVQLQR